MNRYVELAVTAIGMFILAMMLDLAITGITPQEFLADIACRF
jgi:hypothetical protein